MLNLPAFGGSVLGLKTASAGTAFAHLVPPAPDNKQGYTRVMLIGYTAGNTAHNVGVMLPLGQTTTSAASNVNTNTLTLTADPGPSGNGIAANDYIAVEHADGTTQAYTVSAWNGTSKVLTINSNLAANVASGADVWDFGVVGDTDPVTGVAHKQFPTTANTTVNRTFGTGVRSHTKRSPVLIYSPNGTGAGVLDCVEYAYTVE